MMEQDATKQFVEIMNLQRHDDIVSSIAVCPSQDGLILSGSLDRRYLKHARLIYFSIIHVIMIWSALDQKYYQELITPFSRVGLSFLEFVRMMI